MIKMLTKFLIVGYVSLLLLTGCDLSITYADETAGETKGEDVIASDRATVCEGRKIELSTFTLTLPKGYSYAIWEREDYSTYYVWKTTDEVEDHILPSENRILFYITDGIDLASPDAVIEDSQAMNSIKSVHMAPFQTETGARMSIDPALTKNDHWYCLCFTGFNGDYLMTSYGTLCYPKTYYGVYVLQKETATHTRNYSGFVFSNDNSGDIFTEEEYNSVFEQIKAAYGLTEFYDVAKNAVIYDPLQDTSNGRTYYQIEELFHNTENYYIMSGLRSPSVEKDEPTSEPETEPSSEEASPSAGS